MAESHREPKSLFDCSPNCGPPWAGRVDQSIKFEFHFHSASRCQATTTTSWMTPSDWIDLLCSDHSRTRDIGAVRYYDESAGVSRQGRSRIESPINSSAGEYAPLIDLSQSAANSVQGGPISTESPRQKWWSINGAWPDPPTSCWDFLCGRSSPETPANRRKYLQHQCRGFGNGYLQSRSIQSEAHPGSCCRGLTPRSGVKRNSVFNESHFSCRRWTAIGRAIKKRDFGSQ